MLEYYNVVSVVGFSGQHVLTPVLYTLIAVIYMHTGLVTHIRHQYHVSRYTKNKVTTKLT